MKQIVVFFITMLLIACNTNTAMNVKRVEIANTETFEFTSRNTGKTYNIDIALPRSYNQTPEQKYPTLYIADSQWHFPLWNGITGFIKNDGDMPDALLVGVGWQNNNGNLMRQRIEDLSPTAIAEIPNSGGAEKFQAFLRDELFPYIESHYRVTQNRTLTGGSNSALFTFYTLISQPDLFDGYIASSPNTNWDDGAILKILESFPQNGMKTQKRAYLCWGNLERDATMSEFSMKLAARELKNLEFKGGPISDAGHSGDNAECFNRGLQFVYAKPNIQLSDAILKYYVGTYYTKEKDYSITISLVDHHLTMSYADGTAMNLSTEKQDRFYVRGNVLVFDFKADANNTVNEVKVWQHNELTEFSRVDK